MPRPTSLEDEIVSALRRIAQAMDLRSRDLLSGHGLTSGQLTALRTIAEEQPIPAGAIARRIHLSQATVTGILRRLEHRELVDRSRTDSDRRNVLLCLTEKGRQTVRSAPSLLRDQFRDQLSHLQDWEQTAILSTLQRLAQMMHGDRPAKRRKRATVARTNSHCISRNGEVMAEFEQERVENSPADASAGTPTRDEATPDEPTFVAD